MVTYKIDLDITPGGIPKIVHVKQYQTDATLEFKLHTRRGTLNIGNVTDCSIRGTKIDGNGYSASATFTPSSTTVAVSLTAQMTAVAGRQPYEITVTDSTGKMITATFYLDVQRAAFDLDTISDSDIREITNALDHSSEILEAYNQSTYDNTPTANSNHAVKSGGIKTYVDNAVTSGINSYSQTVNTALSAKLDTPQTGTTGQFLRKAANGNEWVDLVTDTDTTLEQSGVPADSKATGDKIGDLEGTFNSFVDGTSVDYVAQSIDVNSGYCTEAGYTTNSAYRTYVYRIDSNDLRVTVSGANDGSRQVAFISINNSTAADTHKVLSTLEANDQNVYTRSVIIPSGYSRLYICVSKSYVDTYGAPIVYIDEMVIDSAPSSQDVQLTHLSNRYILADGTPSSTTTSSWALMIADVSDIGVVRITTYKSSSSSYPVWSFSSVDYQNATVDALRNASTIVDKGKSISTTGTIQYTLTVPSTAKTMLVSCAATQESNYKTFVALYFKEFYFLKDIPDLMNEVTETRDMVDSSLSSRKINLVHLSNRYITTAGIPSSTTTSSWALMIADVDGVDSVRFTSYKTSSSALPIWSFSSVEYDDATIANLSDITKVVLKGDDTTAIGEIEYTLTVPSTAKTIMIACASAQESTHNKLTALKYSDFDFLASVPDLIEEYPKIRALNAYSTSPYYRSVRWGPASLGAYYHSVDNGTSLFTGATTAAEYYDLCNTLFSNYSGYVEAHEMGVASDGNTMMYYYTFNPVTNQDGTNYKRPKMIISAGQHGFEKVACFGLYWFMKDLVENWESNDTLAYIRNHVQLVIMPLLNPWGFDNDKYVNANGVNLNRNWGTSAWSSGTSGSTSYGGAAPFDQPETQYARDVVLNNLDALWLCDYHNNGQAAPSTPRGYLWHSFALMTYDDVYFTKAINAAKWHIDEITGHLYKDYPGVCDYVISGNFTDNNAPSHQGLIVAYAREQGIMAATMEGGAAFIGSGNRYTSPIHHMNADLIGNWIRCILSTYSHYSD